MSLKQANDFSSAGCTSSCRNPAQEQPPSAFCILVFVTTLSLLGRSAATVVPSATSTATKTRGPPGVVRRLEFASLSVFLEAGSEVDRKPHETSDLAEVEAVQKLMSVKTGDLVVLGTSEIRLNSSANLDGWDIAIHGAVDGTTVHCPENAPAFAIR